MKKFLILSLAALLTACSSGGTAGGSASGNDIVGTWENGRFLYEYTSDGEILSSLNIEGYEDQKEDWGEYHFSGTDLVVDRETGGETTYTKTTDIDEAKEYVNFYYLEGDTFILGATEYTKVTQ